MNNIFLVIPEIFEDERFDTLIKGTNVRIERILSQGHASPKVGWYDQAENEWVMVLQGAGTVQFADGQEVMLKKGDHVNIPAHAKHRVLWTEPNEVTIWLAVFYV